MASLQCQNIYELIEHSRFDLDRPLADQINRSSGSVMDNIAEGFDRFTKADFRHFLIIARGSNAEVRSQLYRAKARKHITDDEAGKLIQDARHLGIKSTASFNILTSLSIKQNLNQNLISLQKQRLDTTSQKAYPMTCQQNSSL